MGIFGFNEDNILAEKVFFPKNVLQTAKRLRKIEEGTLIEEVLDLINKLQTKGYTHFIFENQEMSRRASKS